MKRRLLATMLSACMALSLLPTAVFAVDTPIDAAAYSEAGVPVSKVWAEYSADTIESGVYAIVSDGTAGGNNRILYHTGNGMTDKVGTSLSKDGGYLSFNASFSISRQTWEVVPVEGGYTVKSVDSGRYLDLTNASAKNVATSEQPVVLSITQADGVYHISKAGGSALSFTNDGNIFASAEASGWHLFTEKEVAATVVEDSTPAPGTTVDQPFALGTGGSTEFRIPSLVTLNNGDLFAAIDARWNTTGDGGGLDTIVSVSQDQGKNWNYSFPNYFNDSTEAWNGFATAFIDPVTVVGKDGAIYMMVDLFPGGNGLNSAAAQPARSTGYVEINGTQRLALYKADTEQTDENYTYYVGDFADGYAPVLNVDGSKSGYYVDDHYYLYRKDGDDLKTTYCARIGSTEYVRQNVFYYNSIIKVRNATYLWLIKSTDNGATWSAPMILNPQIRNAADPDNFYGVGPGRGLCLEDGTLMLPCYTFRVGGPGNAGQISSFIYSTDNGETWSRSEDATTNDHWSSESALVEIDANTVRQFYRDGNDNLTYTDHTRQEDGSWKAGDIVEVTNVFNSGNNQLSAIKYSKQINGKDVILVSTSSGPWATGSQSNPVARSNGVIHVLLLNENKTMQLYNTIPVNEGRFNYSCLTEMADGTVALLYEGENDHMDIRFETFSLDDLDPKFDLEVHLYNSYTICNTVPTQEDLAAMDTSFLSAKAVDGNTVLTGLKEGTTKFTIEGVTYNITITPEVMTEIPLKTGETMSYTMLPEGVVKHEADPKVADVKIEKVDNSANMEVMLGNTADFSDSKAALSTALYHFVGNNEDGFTASAQAADGSTVYFNIGAHDNRCPNSTEASDKITVEKGGMNGTFYLYGKSGEALTLWILGNNPSFVTWSPSADHGSFMLYRPAADGETSSALLPGYVQVTDPDEVVEGDYLVVFKSDYRVGSSIFSNCYILYPSADMGNIRAHMAKLQPAVYYNMDITGISGGVTDVMVDGVIYRITVESQSSSGSSSGKRYDVTAEQADGGSIKLDKTRASRGSTVTVTVKPEDGYELDELIVNDAKGNSVDVTDKGNGKYIFRMPGSDVTVEPVFVKGNESALPFTDVSSNSWYYGAVRYAYRNDLMSGVSANKFAPDMTTTRGMIVTILHALEEKPAASGSPFKDVTADLYCAKAVAWATSNGIVAGYGDGLFGPNDSITREQMAAILYSYAQYKGYDTTERADLSRFVDASAVSGYAKDAMSWAVAEGLISGMGNGSLAPDNSATRAQVATILMAFIDSQTK